MGKTFKELLAEDPSLADRITKLPQLQLCPVEVRKTTFEQETKTRYNPNRHFKYEDGKKVTIH